jgi:hypothetical protein
MFITAAILDTIIAKYLSVPSTHCDLDQLWLNVTAPSSLTVSSLKL